MNRNSRSQGIGFTLCGALGFAAANSGCVYQGSLATFWGSWCFLVGSVIQWYESLSKHSVEVEQGGGRIGDTQPVAWFRFGCSVWVDNLGFHEHVPFGGINWLGLKGMAFKNPIIEIGGALSQEAILHVYYCKNISRSTEAFSWTRLSYEMHYLMSIPIPSILNMR
jgi:hypothetical protein